MVQEDQEPLSAVVLRGLQGIGGCAVPIWQPAQSIRQVTIVQFFLSLLSLHCSSSALLAVSVYAIKSLKTAL